LWEVKTGQPASQLLPSSWGQTDVVLLPDNKTVVVSSIGQDLRALQLSDGRLSEIAKISGHRNEIWSLALSPDGTTLASGSKDGEIRLWNVSVFTERRLSEDRLPEHEFQSFGFSVDGRTAVTLAPDAMHFWSSASLTNTATQ